jgi:hypothetical protein
MKNPIRNFLESKPAKIVTVVCAIAIPSMAFLCFVRSSPASVMANPVMEVQASTQTRELLWSGYDLDELQQRGLPSSAKAHLKATKKFPTTESCITKSAQDNKSVNLTQVAWSKIRSLPELDVCLYRIASSLGSETKIVAWFEMVGFEAQAMPNDIVPGGWLIWASWSEGRHGTITPFTRPIGLVVLDRLLLSEDARVMGVTMHLDSDLQPTSVESNFVLK